LRDVDEVVDPLESGGEKADGAHLARATTDPVPPRETHEEAFVLGVFVELAPVARDREANVEAVELFARVAPPIAEAFVAVRAGLTHGPVELLDDADGTRNAIGVCLNRAARLAVATNNPGVTSTRSSAFPRPPTKKPSRRRTGSSR